VHPAIPDEPGQVDTSRVGEHSVAKLGDFPVGLWVYATTLSLFSGQSWTGSMLLETRTVQEAAGLLAVSSRRAAPQGPVDERAGVTRRSALTGQLRVRARGRPVVKTRGLSAIERPKPPVGCLQLIRRG